ncbi:MAG: TlpA disulfide reductase family protein [Magnetovibrionaceae bacterium]
MSLARQSFIGLSLIAAWIVFIPTPDARADDDARCQALVSSTEKVRAPNALGGFKESALEIAFYNEANEEVRLKDLQGKGVVLNFWATWCAPCVREMPALDRMKQALEGESVTVLAISQDRQGVPAARKFYDKAGLQSLDVLVDKKSALIRALGGRGLPTTVLINAEGREVGRVEGEWEWDSEEALTLAKACLAPRKGAS